VTRYLSTRRWQTFDATFASIHKNPALVKVRSFAAATPAPAMSSIIEMRTCDKRGLRVTDVFSSGALEVDRSERDAKPKALNTNPQALGTLLHVDIESG
jgi:hypothetical protein